MYHFVFINNLHVLIACQCPLPWALPTQERYTEGGVSRGRGLFCNTELLFWTRRWRAKRRKRIFWHFEETQYLVRPIVINVSNPRHAYIWLLTRVYDEWNDLLSSHSYHGVVASLASRLASAMVLNTYLTCPPRHLVPRRPSQPHTTHVLEYCACVCLSYSSVSLCITTSFHTVNMKIHLCVLPDSESPSFRISHVVIVNAGHTWHFAM